ncbi:prepilin peptidase [Clostridium folliculivorans]|uniref:Prepilin peptidase n=1 Tax=Clostridium folliculivorans TaxID=2886038 RepID=A0A9W5Y4I0_9CLOT|nr:A24 family peptidase [Clostridium folliculivorans]GKU26419.1 prepilin peptidase [Clostridium folliculivorans]GKU32026.1 prepilin peptidase [Clostridium folliculivorans]
MEIGILIFILGLVIGSFLNVCIYRIPRGESISFPPSHCTDCKTQIKPYDLIPVISYLFLGGKCRNCGSKISIKYPLLELFTAIIFLLIYSQYGLSIELIKFLILAVFLIVIAFIDFNTQDVYAVTTYPCLFIGVAFILIDKFYLHSDIMTYLIGLVVGVGVIGLIVILTGAMGTGDIEIAAICGIYLGWSNTLITIFFAFIIGAIIGVLLIALKKKGRKDPIAFGPFLAIGTMIAMLYGDKIIKIYLNI